MKLVAFGAVVRAHHLELAVTVGRGPAARRGPGSVGGVGAPLRGPAWAVMLVNG